MKEQRVALEVRYERGHSYTESWLTSDYFCPCCADQSVWVEDSPGDYYEGPQHLCVACGANFTMPSGCGARSTNWQDKQRLEALRKT